jgi:hypothetical protein
LSNPNDTNGFTDSTGQSVKPGDRVIYSLRAVEGTLVEALQDGDATIELDDGKMLFVKWHRLTKVR